VNGTPKYACKGCDVSKVKHVDILSHIEFCYRLTSIITPSPSTAGLEPKVRNRRQVSTDSVESGISVSTSASLPAVTTEVKSCFKVLNVKSDKFSRLIIKFFSLLISVYEFFNFFIDVSG